MDKKVTNGLSEVCKMLANHSETSPKMKKTFLKYSRTFKLLGGAKQIKPMEEKPMGKKLTDKEREDREVKSIISKIKKLEKTHPQELVERATARYKNANLDKRRAEAEMKELEKKLADAKRRLK